MKKHIVKYKLGGQRKQKTLEAENIYEAERAVRKLNNVSEYSKYLEVVTIKCGRTLYEVNGTTLG